MSPGSTTPRALLRHASVQQVLDAAGDGVVVVQVGGLVAGAGGLAVQAPPHAMAGVNIPTRSTRLSRRQSEQI